MIKNYILNPIKKKDNLKALFFNEIDNTIRKTKEGTVNSGESPDMIEIKEEPVSYQYNYLGFRSEEFTRDHSGEHILFAGCSETEGVGGNLDSVWSYIVYSELSKNNKVSGFFNLARYGWGYDIIIQNIMCYIKDYGKPNKIFILFPNLGRFYNWSDKQEDDLENFEYRGNVPNNIDEDTLKPWMRKISLAEQRSHVITFTMLIKLFEEYCLSNSIDLYWSTWDNEDRENYTTIDIFKNFIPIQDVKTFIENNSDLFLKEIKPRKDWHEKRDGHRGYAFHYNWARSFLDFVDSKKIKQGSNQWLQ